MIVTQIRGDQATKASTSHGEGAKESVAGMTGTRRMQHDDGKDAHNGTAVRRGFRT